MTTRAWKIEAACSVNCWSLPISFSRAYARATLRVLLELVELRVDQLRLERQDDDQIDDAEASRRQRQRQRQAKADPAKPGTAPGHSALGSGSRPPHREDQLRLVWIVLDLFAEMANVDVDRPRLAVVERRRADARAAGAVRRHGRGRRRAPAGSNSTNVSLCLMTADLDGPPGTSIVSSPTSITSRRSRRSPGRGARRSPQERPNTAAKLTDREGFVM